jgi:hypothetical protein
MKVQGRLMQVNIIEIHQVFAKKGKDQVNWQIKNSVKIIFSFNPRRI